MSEKSRQHPAISVKKAKADHQYNWDHLSLPAISNSLYKGMLDHQAKSNTCKCAQTVQMMYQFALQTCSQCSNVHISQRTGIFFE